MTSQELLQGLRDLAEDGLEKVSLRNPFRLPPKRQLGSFAEPGLNLAPSLERVRVRDKIRALFPGGKLSRVQTRGMTFRERARHHATNRVARQDARQIEARERRMARSKGWATEASHTKGQGAMEPVRPTRDEPRHMVGLWARKKGAWLGKGQRPE